MSNKLQNELQNESRDELPSELRKKLPNKRKTASVKMVANFTQNASDKLPECFSQLLDYFVSYCKGELNLSANTISAYKKDIEQFLLFACKNNIKNETSLKEIDVAFVNKYSSSISENGAVASSILRKISSVKKFCEFLMSENIINENPATLTARPKKSVKMPKFLTTQETQKLIDTAFEEYNLACAGVGGNTGVDAKILQSARLFCIVDMLFCTGLRVSELLSLQTADVEKVIKSEENLSSNAGNGNADGGMFLRVVGKGNKERLVPVRRSSLASIRAYYNLAFCVSGNGGVGDLAGYVSGVSGVAGEYDSINAKNKPKVFFYSKSGRSGVLTREAVGIMLKRLAIIANINPSRVSPHVLRHSFATNLCNKQVNLPVIQKLLGHSDISTTQIYLNTTDKQIVDFVQSNHPLTNKTNTDKSSVSKAN